MFYASRHHMTSNDVTWGHMTSRLSHDHHTSLSHDHHIVSHDTTWLSHDPPVFSSGIARDETVWGTSPGEHPGTGLHWAVSPAQTKDHETCMPPTTSQYCIWYNNLVPRLSRNANCTCVESLVSFLRKQDIIKIGLKRKGIVLRVVQRTMHSMLGMSNIQPPITRYML